MADTDTICTARDGSIRCERAAGHGAPHLALLPTYPPEAHRWMDEQQTSQTSQIGRLAACIQEHWAHEIGDEGACDVAIRLLTRFAKEAKPRRLALRRRVVVEQRALVGGERHGLASLAKRVSRRIADCPAELQDAVRAELARADAVFRRVEAAAREIARRRAA